VLSQAVAGAFLPWRDVLHEGPVRAGLSLEQLSRERARFIAAAGWGEASEVLRQFEQRDRAYRAAGQHDEIVLWFEHDLYDQLQLVQVLDGLADLRGPPLSIVCEAEYLGTMTPQRAAELFQLRSPVLRKHLQEAQAAWKAFRSSNPREIETVKLPALAFLGAALRRHLEEFPWITDGHSRLERSVMQALEHGPIPFAKLFALVAEEPAFLGDTVLEWHLRRMQKEGLVEQRQGAWGATGKPRQRREPRWLGGYEVRDETLRWDPASGRLAG
jgi:hypothetical protein